MYCVYMRNVQHHIDTAMLKAARKDILVFHIREQLRLTQACTFETKTSGIGLDPNSLALTFSYCCNIVLETVHFENNSR